MLTTSQLAVRLKQIHKRKFVASELNEYAVKLGKTLLRTESGNFYYLWEKSDIENIKPLID